MLNYTDLSKAQKRWVDLVEECFPDDGDTLSFKQIQDIHEYFTSRRAENPKFKISKALWLITNNAVSRGTYKFPKSTASDVDGPVEVNDELETRYRAELAKLDIKYKNAK
jgi:hypothetical protein